MGRFWLLALVALLSALLSACTRTPDEQRIRAAITAMQHAAEQRRPRDFTAHVSDDFIGNDDPGFDKAALLNLLRVEVLRNDEVGVLLGPIDVDLQGDRATVHVAATITGGKGSLLPERGAVYDITSGWKRQDGEWVCFSGRWEQKL